MTIQTLPNNLAGITFKGTKTPVFSTVSKTAWTGKEIRRAKWPYPKWKFVLSYEFIREDVNDEFANLMGFVLSQRGQYQEFYFHDDNDDSVVGQAIGQGNGVTTDFRLCKTTGGFVDLVYYSPSVDAVYVNGVQQMTGWTRFASGNYGFDSIRFDTPPSVGAVITADFSYYYVCRFNADEYDFDQIWYRFWELKTLDFITVF